MIQVFLLKNYENNSAGDIISVSNNVAFGLIDSGTARSVQNRDFLVRPEFGTSRAINIKRKRK